MTFKGHLEQYVTTLKLDFIIVPDVVEVGGEGPTGGSIIKLSFYVVTYCSK